MLVMPRPVLTAFDSHIAFTIGIPMTLGLLAGPFSDQMFFQRSYAVNAKHVGKTFILGGLLFGIIPIILSLLGFIGAGMAEQGLLKVTDPQMVGPLVINSLLPDIFLYGFCLMAFAGLCSTIDSSLCAFSSLFSIDIYRRYINPAASDQRLLKTSRLAMIGFSILGALIGALEPKLLWVFLIYGALASAGMFPFMFSILSKNVTARGLTYGIMLGLILGLPLSIYANVNENSLLIVIAATLSVIPGLLVLLLMREKVGLNTTDLNNHEPQNISA
jgi:Na+/proline symporter